MRSESCQSGPCSSKTTFLPALASTAAKVEPEAPAPTMTTSTFSFVAMSPPLGRRDVRHVGNAQRFVARHRAVHHVDRIGAQQGVDERRWWPLPAFELILAHAVDKIVLVRRRQFDEALTLRLAHAIDGAERGTIEVRVGRPHIEDAGFEQRFLRWARNLLIDKLDDTGLTRAGSKSLAQRFERFRLIGVERTQWHALRVCFPRSEKNFGTANREGKRAKGRALNKGTPFQRLHVKHPPETEAKIISLIVPQLYSALFASGGQRSALVEGIDIRHRTGRESAKRMSNPKLH